MLEDLSKKWLHVELSHSISKAASDALWELGLKFFAPLIRAKEQEYTTKKTPQFHSLRRKLYKKFAPPVIIETGCKDKDGAINVITDSKTVKNSKKVYEIATIPVSYTRSLHEQTCPNFSPTVQLSLDGVTESKSSSVCLDVYSSKFENCRQIYPHRIIRPIDKYQVPLRPQLSSILEDLEENSVCISAFIGDNPKRALVREALSHSARFACEYCTGSAQRISQTNLEEEEKKCTDKKKNLEEQIKLLERLPSTSTNTNVCLLYTSPSPRDS